MASANSKELTLIISSEYEYLLAQNIIDDLTIFSQFDNDLQDMIKQIAESNCSFSIQQIGNIQQKRNNVRKNHDKFIKMTRDELETKIQKIIKLCTSKPDKDINIIYILNKQAKYRPILFWIAQYESNKDLDAEIVWSKLTKDTQIKLMSYYTTTELALDMV